MTMMIGNEQIPLEYAKNIWTDQRKAVTLVAIAIITSLALVGFYLNFPLQGLGFQQIGQLMIGSAIVLAIIEAVTIFISLHQSKPHVVINEENFGSLSRFKGVEKGFDFLKFKDNRSSFVAYFQKNGDVSRVIVFKDNQLAAKFHEKVAENYKWVIAEPH